MIDDLELEQRLRRTFDVIATTPLAAPPLPRRVPLARWAAAAAAVVLVAGGVVVAVQPDDTTVTITEQGPVELPVPNTEAEVTRFRGEERLIGDCMITAGWPYRERRIEPGRVDELWDALGRTDGARAANVGYAVAEPPGPRIDGLTFVPSPSRASWLGGLTTCTAEVTDELYGDGQRYAELQAVAAGVERDVRQAVAADGRYRRALSRWVACMADLGHAATDPRALLESFGTAPGDPSDAELQAAQDDVGCKASTGLVGAYREVEADVRVDIEAPHDLELRALEAMQQSALPIARDAISVPAIYYRAPQEAGGPPPVTFPGTEVAIAPSITEHSLGGKHWVVIDASPPPGVAVEWFQVLRDGVPRQARRWADIAGAPFGARMDPILAGTEVQVVFTDAAGTVLAAGPVETLGFGG